MVWDASETFQQRGQHGEYNLTPEGDHKTRVRFDIIMDLHAPVPEFIIKRAKKIVLDVATERLRRCGMDKASWYTPPEAGLYALADVDALRTRALGKSSHRRE
jgi:hypothetical protein